MTLFQSHAQTNRPQAANQTPSDTSLQMSPGQLLSQARETWGLSHDQVATTLRLPTSTIIALEEDRYQGLPPAAFIRGYLSGYARLVGLDADKLLAACEMRGCGNPSLAAQRSPSLKKGRWETLVRWGSYGILAGLIVATMAYWIANDDYTNTELPAIPITASIKPDSDAPAPKDTGRAENDNMGFAPTVSGPGPGLTAGTRFTATSQPPHTAPTDSPVAALTTTQGTAPTNAKAKAGDTSTWPTLELEFKADSWIAVRDADGKRLAWETVKAGSSRHLRGIPPIKVVLGNALAVRVTYQGELFDPTPYTSGRIARFIVE